MKPKEVFMPNWCDNRISITGPNALINKISMTVNAEEGILNVIAPIPAELKDSVSGSENAKPDWQKKQSKELIKKYGYDNWYDWCLNNWGTKWDLCEYYADLPSFREYFDDGMSRINFGSSSAWSPPIGALTHFISENEDVDVKCLYYEGGCDFMGIWDNGADECYEPSQYNSESRFWTFGDGKQLDDHFGLVEQMAEYEAEQDREEVQQWYDEGKKELNLA